MARLAVLAILLFSIWQLREMKEPSKTAWARHLAEGKDPTVAEHVQVGMWYGAACRAVVSGLLLAVSLLWDRFRTGAEQRPIRLAGEPMEARTFWCIAACIMIGAAALRLPRMSQSFWGDEADAVATYVHGQYRPFKKKDPQGALYFEGMPWSFTFFSARHGPNNHVLFSVTSRLCLDAWRKATGHSKTEFTEWPVRVPPLIAGFGSLVAIASLGRRWGSPRTGLFAAAFLAIHPWHVRYTTEARGYALALLFLILVLLAVTLALERQSWLRWIFFGVMEFLVMYSWPGAAYPLVFMNLALVVVLLRRRDRWVHLTRWFTVSAAAGAIFVSLYAPHLPQIKQYNLTHLWMKGMPMDATWLHNVMASPFAGIPYHGPVGTEVVYPSWQQLLHFSPVLTVLGFGAIGVLMLVGLWSLWKQNGEVGALVSAGLAAAVVATLHFKFVIGDEMRTWYLLFTLPSLAIAVAAGMEALCSAALHLGASMRWSWAPGVLMLSLITSSVGPMERALISRSAEDFKGVMALTRGKHETFDPKGRAEVSVCWLWRYAALYDPRGEIHVRDAASLQQRMDDARAAKHDLFLVVGFRELAEAQNADMLRVLDDPAVFEKAAFLPAYEPLHTLEVYRMKPQALAER